LEIRHRALSIQDVELEARRECHAAVPQNLELHRQGLKVEPCSLILLFPDFEGADFRKFEMVSVLLLMRRESLRLHLIFAAVRT
jgi:hypothetical protein